MDDGEAYRLLRAAVDAILRHNEEARAAFDGMRALGLGETEAKEEVARVLMAVMYHVGAQSERLRGAGGAAGLRREAFARLARGETARQVFEGGTDGGGEG